MTLSISFDTVAEAAYIRLSSGTVARTCDFNDDVMVDLDEHNIAVGVEIINMGAPLPFSALVSDFHVHSEVVEQLRTIWPGVVSGLSFSHGNDGFLTESQHRTLQLT